MRLRQPSTALSLLFASTLPLIALPCSADTARDAALIEHGRYLAITSGCNDCHTPGYMMKHGQVAQDIWLTGDNFGWRGPWGTTYAPNLRLYVQGMTEAQWIENARSLKTRPPMPWFSLNAMREEDLRALYRFIVSLGEPGEPAPAYVPPDQEPATPYALFPSPPEQPPQP